MKRLFSIQFSAPFHPGKGVYIANDYTLAYDTLRIKPSFKDASSQSKYATWWISYDTLSVGFDFYTREFISLDMYTNKELWIENPTLTIPKELDGQGKLLFASQSELDPEKRYSFKIVPVIEYAPKGCVEINLIQEHKYKYFKVSENMYVSLYQGALSSILLSDVSYM